MALTDGIIGCWSPSLGASGYRLLDRSRYANHGVLTNMDAGTDWVGSAKGVALSYSSTKRVQTGKPVLSGTGAWTIEAWIYPTGTTGFRAIAGNYGAANGTGVQIGVLATTNLLSVYYGSASIASTSAAAANSWTHVAVTRIGNAVQWYVNGVPAGSGTNTGTVGSALNWAIGNGVDYAGEQFVGTIGDTAVFTLAKTAGEIMEICRRGNGAIGRELTGQTRRRTYGFVAAGFRPYWAARRTQIIGGGVK
jgi:hypothetical protein